eukprot:GGOE01053292.1.p2 GENE.GGOE01053292.1~~GGOE01053292.1.p2  ORF type:complete len:308 (-),score=73.06 GGOE01053292.1:413-1336(-)
MLTALQSIAFSLTGPLIGKPKLDTFFEACQQADYETLQGLLTSQAVSIDEQNPWHFDWTALHYAADADDAGFVGFLVQRQANLAIRAADGRTPLQWARDMGRQQAASVLEAYGSIGEECGPEASESLKSTLPSQIVRKKANGMASAAVRAVVQFLEPLGVEGNSSSGRSAFTDVAELTIEITTAARQSVGAVSASATAAGAQAASFVTQHLLSRGAEQGALDGDLNDMLPAIHSFGHLDANLHERDKCNAASTSNPCLVPLDGRHSRVQSFSTLSVAPSTVTQEDLDADFEFLEAFDASRPSEVEVM